MNSKGGGAKMGTGEYVGAISAHFGLGLGVVGRVGTHTSFCTADAGAPDGKGAVRH